MSSFFSPPTCCSDLTCSTRPPRPASEHLPRFCSLRRRPHSRCRLARLIIFIRRSSNPNVPCDPLMCSISLLLPLKHMLRDDRELRFVHFYIPNTRFLPDAQRNRGRSIHRFFLSIFSCPYYWPFLYVLQRDVYSDTLPIFN